MSRRRVLLVTDVFSGGRASRHVQAILGRLSRRHHDVRVVTLFDGAEPPPELGRARVPSHHLALTGDEEVQDIARRLADAVAEADLVHAHSVSGGMAANLAAGGRPVLTTVHALPGSGGPALPPDVEPGQVAGALVEGDGPRRLLATTGALRRELEAGGAVDVEVMPPFVDVEETRRSVGEIDRASARRQWGVQQGQVAVLHDSDIRREHRPLVLLEAYRVALRELPSLRLFLAGDGPAMPEARELAERLDLGDSMVFLQAQGDLSAIRRASDVFVLPAAGSVFPHGLLDGMATGLPSVVGGDEPELDPVAAGAGLRAAPDRVEHLASRILALAFDPGERAEMGRRAAERASRFDVGAWIPRLEELYAEL